MAAIAAMALRPSTPSQLSPPHHGLAVQRGPAAKSRTRGAMLRFAAVFCGIVSARSFTATKAVGTDRASRTASTATEAGDGRKVQIKAEKVKEVKLQDAEMKIMDDLMRKEAVNILAAGAERTEEVKGAKGLWYAYMKPTRMGTWKNQARLKCKLELAKSGAVNVEVVEIEVGSWDRDLQKFIYEKFAEESFSLNWMNSLTWKEKGNDLYLLHTASDKDKEQNIFLSLSS